MSENFERSREASRLTLGRVDKYEELNAPSEKEADKVFAKKTRELWREFAVQRVFGENKKTGELELKNRSDLDGNTAVSLLRLAGFKIPDQGIFIPPSQTKEGAIHIDTGDKSGVVVEFDERTGYFDHHGPDPLNDTSATELVYKTLIEMKLLRPDPSLERLVEFVTQLDNKTFPDQAKHFFEQHHTLLGLAGYMSFKQLRKAFKEGKSPIGILSKEEIKTLGARVEESSHNLEGMIEAAQKRFPGLERDGFVVDSSLGKLIIDINRTLPGGYDAARAFGADAYLMWNPESDSFFLSSHRGIRQKISQGKIVRGTMMIKPRHNGEALSVYLGNILKTFNVDAENIGPHLAQAILADGLRAHDYEVTIDSIKEGNRTSHTLKEFEPVLGKPLVIPRCTAKRGEKIWVRIKKDTHPGYPDGHFIGEAVGSKTAK